MPSTNITAESDWLSTETYFYNIRSGKVSENISDVIDFNQFEWNLSGLENYISYGYSVFGETPLKDVKFLEPNSKLIQNTNGEFTVVTNEERENAIVNDLETETDKEEIVELIISKIRNWEKLQKGNIILPLSGGYDSRFIFSAIENKKKLKCFTYGLSNSQLKSMEVVKAKKITEKFDVDWNFIKLGNYHQFLNDWYKVFGCSTHAHGMYHIEFYKKIKLTSDPGSEPFLSGLIGDAWSGNVKIPKISSPEELTQLGYSHGMNASTDYFLQKPRENEYSAIYFDNKMDLLKIPKFRVIEAMRLKMMLLKYLIKLPKKNGFRVYAPFIDEQVALGMLNLPEAEKKNRKWQSEYFNANGLNIEKLSMKFDSFNTLHSQALRNAPLPPLSEKLLSELFERRYVSWINSNLLNTPRSLLIHSLHKFLRNKRLIHRFTPKDPHLTAYFAYMVIYPLQRLIEKRDSELSN